MLNLKQDPENDSSHNKQDKKVKNMNLKTFVSGGKLNNSVLY